MGDKKEIVALEERSELLSKALPLLKAAGAALEGMRDLRISHDERGERIDRLEDKIAKQPVDRLHEYQELQKKREAENAKWRELVHDLEKDSAAHARAAVRRGEAMERMYDIFTSSDGLPLTDEETADIEAMYYSDGRAR